MSNRTINETIDNLISLVRAIAFGEQHIEPEPIDIDYDEFVAERFVVISFNIAIICKYGVMFGVEEDDNDDLFYSVDAGLLDEHPEDSIEVLVARLGCAYRNQDTAHFSALLEAAGDERVMQTHRFLCYETASILIEQGQSVDLSGMRFPRDLTYDDYLNLGDAKDAARWN